ncbi:hypothetical protein, partial [Burkholderia pyrrocinia]|uniref:hypothetical protein n=1 Tax=Burkholderia pyrrocinia TaxID=60550 RepID=UPI0037D88039
MKDKTALRQAAPCDGQIREEGYSEEFAVRLISRGADPIAVAARVDGSMVATAVRAAIMCADLTIWPERVLANRLDGLQCSDQHLRHPAPSALLVARAGLHFVRANAKTPAFWAGVSGLGSLT